MQHMPDDVLRHMAEYVDKDTYFGMRRATKGFDAALRERSFTGRRFAVCSKLDQLKAKNSISEDEYLRLRGRLVA